MIYKYQAQIDSLRLSKIDCLCEVAWPRQELAYRLVHLPAHDTSNFLPRPLEPGVPSRQLRVPADFNPPDELKADLENINAWGISLFENVDAARRLANKYKKAFQGHTHVAVVQIEFGDGVCTETDFNKHYNLHESYDANLGNQVQRVIPR